MERRALLIAGVALSVGLWAASLGAMAQTSVTSLPPPVLDVLPESTQRRIAANPERFLQHVLASLRKVDPDGEVTLEDMELHEAVLHARERAKYLHKLLERDLNGDGIVTEDEYRKHAAAGRKDAQAGFEKYAALSDANDETAAGSKGDVVELRR